MLVLGIESSCDETAVAIIKTPKTVLADIVASQNELHAPFGGVVPEIASRRHMENIVPLLNAALKKAGCSLDDIGGIAVTRAPGLIGALLVGVSFAKALSYAKQKPLIGINHLEGHLNAAHLEYDDISYPHIGLVVSGGHTSLYLVKEFGNYKLLGATRDDAAGEAFDKVAKLLGLGYPGGPAIDKIAPSGDPKSFKFARPKLNRGSRFEISELDFSFSGIKTEVMLKIKKMGGSLSKNDIINIAASFQYTVVDIISNQILKACVKYSCFDCVVSGGVAANSLLRKSLAKVCSENKLRLFLPSLSYCTDNASMIAFVGAKRLEAGLSDNFGIKACANEEIGVI
ncbi:MAG: tRNA (adenosine(37)-N6)-threonylcarbamoyltransferase complex transferase subunit TsaD [Deltaproteobacteria bacterium]|nr:tRNA (adenosine(37)-N6)-threonylcarbamoyltransferase complex transferase subunit TsaD [Deltaproteobacteria bacterium]